VDGVAGVEHDPVRKLVEDAEDEKQPAPLVGDIQHALPLKEGRLVERHIHQVGFSGRPRVRYRRNAAVDRKHRAHVELVPCTLVDRDDPAASDFVRIAVGGDDAAVDGSVGRMRGVAHQLSARRRNEPIAKKNLFVGSVDAEGCHRRKPLDLGSAEETLLDAQQFLSVGRKVLPPLPVDVPLVACLGIDVDRVDDVAFGADHPHVASRDHLRRADETVGSGDERAREIGLDVARGDRGNRRHLQRRNTHGRR